MEQSEFNRGEYVNILNRNTSEVFEYVCFDKDKNKHVVKYIDSFSFIYVYLPEIIPVKVEYEYEKFIQGDMVKFKGDSGSVFRFVARYKSGISNYCVMELNGELIFNRLDNIKLVEEEVSPVSMPKKYSSRFIPKIGESFSWIDSIGNIKNSKFEGIKMQKNLIALGNCFESDEECNRHIQREKLYVEMIDSMDDINYDALLKEERVDIDNINFEADNDSEDTCYLVQGVDYKFNYYIGDPIEDSATHVTIFIFKNKACYDNFVDKFQQKVIDFRLKI
jgi:hypothetical protein